MKLDMHDIFEHQKVKLNTDKQDLQGKTLLITGANAEADKVLNDSLLKGIGLESAKQLAHMNPSKIILACRNMTTAEEAIKAIKASGFDNIEAWHLDQDSFASVKAFTKKYNDSGLDLHLLLANAGKLPMKSGTGFELSADGHESIIETNHLGAALLTFGLLHAVRRTAAKATEERLIPRIVIVASDVHYVTEFKISQNEGNIIKAFDDPKNWTDTFSRYMDSKLLNVFFAQELAIKIKQSKVPEDSKIVVSSCNPGIVMSKEMAKDEASIIPAPFRAVARDFPEGCQTHLFASIDPSAGKPGDSHFYHNCKATETADITLGEQGDALRERVWRDTLKVLGVTEQELLL
ncbi:hypothetical protein INT43_008006 [Umbelopsis isabellina]|uniref:Uncharacterized protein n=1 Tax=Mortierella isabellina TaxID=91625 RepID=A0A8H7PPT7_MORIS|nr:hypothetical protein INT43_008006 [Umbelopsis isabellina]